MKTNLRNGFLILSLIGFSISGHTQVTASANVSATIVTPISITKTYDLNFGNIAPSSSGGEVVIDPAGSRSASGGVTLPGTVGTVAAASFHVTGTPNYSYSITLPSVPLTISSGGDNMTVNVFASEPAVTGTLDASGSQTINVGATLHVVGSQTPGFYASGTPFTVTVNYN
jgi:hypothetical protein